MQVRCSLPNVLILALLLALSSRVASASTVALVTSANPALLGTNVTLTATVSPSSATGTVGFYDGATSLGIASVSAGQATVSTRLLPCCAQTITARYNGDNLNAASVSAQLKQTVVVPAQNGVGAPATYGTGANPQSIVAGDFNGDGIIDLAVANAGELTISVFLGAGNGIFQAGRLFSSGSDPYALAVADVNGDGKPDLAVANSADSTVSILLGNGDGTFQNPIAYATGLDPVAIVAADFNGDGFIDLATANFYDGDVTILLGNGNGTFASSANFAVGSGPVSLVAADFNNDGMIDLAIANSNDNDVAILLGKGSGSFATVVTTAAGLGPFGIVAGDFNNDGVIDLAVADFGAYSNQQGGGVSVLLGSGNGTFRAAIASPAGAAPQGLAAGDMNGDGTLDLVVANQSGVSILTGKGDGSFQPPVAVAAGTSTLAIALADFNGDSLTDMVVANFNSNDVAVLLGSAGTCSYTLATPVPTTVPYLWDSNGGTFTLDVTSNSPGCTWSATVAPWISPGTYTSLGSGPVTVVVQPNTTGYTRSGSFTIGNQSFAVAQTITAQTFTDVPLGVYYFDAVNLLKNKNITSGCGPTTFCPLTVINRAEMAIFLTRAVYGSDDFTSSPIPYFKDVPANGYAFAWIQKLDELGITTGCGNGDFCPTEAVSRDQMAIFLIRARFGATAFFDSPATPFFVDVPANYWAFRWIQRMRVDSITTGCSPTDYCPTDAVTRGDMAIFLMRGLFDQLLPPDTPILTEVTPNIIGNGLASVVTITGLNTTFSASQTTISPIAGVQIGAITVISPTSLTVTLTAAPVPSTQPLSIVVITGTQEAVLPNALTIQ